MRTRFNKHKYLRVLKFNSDKSCEINYYLATNRPNFLINPNHVFFWKGYRTVIITDTASETINPLDFESKFDSKHFTNAIESKLISDTFASLKPKFDPLMILIAINIIFTFAIIYLLLKGQGMV